MSTTAPPPEDLPSYRSDTVTLRPAVEADIPHLARLWATAFPGERTAAERARGLREGTDSYGGRETCWVGEADGRFVGALRSYPLRMHLWGREFAVQGLAAVAVTPGARRQGVGNLMCRAALEGGREAGMEISALFPYRADFYRRLGYTLAGELHRYVAAPGEFPRFPRGREARLAEGDEVLRLLPPFYERLRPRSQGLIARSPRLWSFLEDPGHRIVVVPGSDSAGGGASVLDPAGGDASASRSTGGDALVPRSADGVASVPDPAGGGASDSRSAGGGASVPGSAGGGGPTLDAGSNTPEAPPHGIRGYMVVRLEPGRNRERATLHVVESLVEDLAAHQALLGWISLQRDQWGRVIYDALPGEHLERLLGHPRRQGSRGARGGGLWFPAATLLRGPMLRILNLEKVLRWAPLPPGATLAVRDPVIEANTGQWSGAGREGASAEREGPEAGPGALPIGLVTELFLDGALPGQRDTVGDWTPVMGIRDFRLLNTF